MVKGRVSCKVFLGYEVDLDGLISQVPGSRVEGERRACGVDIETVDVGPPRDGCRPLAVQVNQEILHCLIGLLFLYCCYTHLN